LGGFTYRMHQHVNGTDWPTWREMVDTDKRIIMLYYDGGETQF
jgi:hypothetical protein